MMHGFGVFGLLLMLLFWFGLILISVWIVRSLFRGDIKTGRNPSDGHETIKEILDKRYARGEIDRDQYEEMKKEIL
jgi:putative membrane protein